MGIFNKLFKRKQDVPQLDTVAKNSQEEWENFKKEALSDAIERHFFNVPLLEEGILKTAKQ